MAPNRRALLTLLKMTDLCIGIASFLAAVAMTSGAGDFHEWIEFLEMRVKLQNALFVAAYFAFWHFMLRGAGLYRSYRLSAASRELRDIAVAVAASVAPLVLFGPLFNLYAINLPFLAIFGPLAFVGLGLERRLLRTIGRWVRRYGRNLRNVIIIGTGDTALEITSKLAQREDLGYVVVEVVDTVAGSNGNGADASVTLKKVQALIEQRPVDEVFVALPLDVSHSLVGSLISVCEEQGITVRVLAHVAALYWAQARVDEIEGQPVLTMCTGRAESPGLLAKRALDIVGATIGLVVAAPLFLVTALLVKLDSPGPVFFAQERVGFKRRRFRAHKFRTMVVGAEKMQPMLEPLNEADGPVFKIENDPRVTRVGRWLRRLSIDELPQLFNVLRGEMSLVGPRPLPVRDVSRIEVRWHKRRFSVKPGITCLWQARSREPKFDEWIRSDMEYIDNWSLALDFKILMKTIPAVLSGQGAH